MKVIRECPRCKKSVSLESWKRVFIGKSTCQSCGQILTPTFKYPAKQLIMTFAAIISLVIIGKVFKGYFAAHYPLDVIWKVIVMTSFAAPLYISFRNLELEEYVGKD